MGIFGNKETGSVTSEPWDPSQPGLQTILDDILAWYNGGGGTARPPGDLTAGMGSTTTGAIDALGEIAGAAPTGPVTDPADLGLYGDVYGSARAPTASETYLAGMAEDGGGVNPHLQSYIDLGAGAISDQVRASYLDKGRYGSRRFEETLADSIGDFATPLLFEGYNADQNRRLAAAGQIDSSRQGSIGSALASLAGGGAERTRTMGDRLAATNALLSGGMLEDVHSQAALDDESDRYLWEHGGAEKSSIADLLQIVGPVAGLGGTETAMEPRAPFRNILAALASIAGGLA